MKENNLTVKLIPIMLGFLAMGFVDFVGTAANYAQKDFGLTEQQTGFLPSMVFLWFLVFSIPAGLLMNRIGRKNTVLLSLCVTGLAVLLPLLKFVDASLYNFPMMVLFCCLLGIGNTLIQVSLNPLISNLISSDKLTSALTFGQFLKAVASFSAPLLATFFAQRYGNWQLAFGVLFFISILAIVLLNFTHIQRESEQAKVSSFSQAFSLLSDRFILFSFLGILCHVGLDIGINLIAPKLLMNATGSNLDGATHATSVYFAFRTAGAFLGAFLLTKISVRNFFAAGVFLILLALTLFIFFPENSNAVYAGLALVGLGNSNIFSIFFAQALLHQPQKQNEVSALMVMGISGGALFSWLLGTAIDQYGLIGAMIVLLFTVAYFVFFIPQMKKA